MKLKFYCCVIANCIFQFLLWFLINHPIWYPITMSVVGYTVYWIMWKTDYL